MRTNIIIDDQLIDDAIKATGLKTKREVIELGLKTLIKLKQQEKIKAYRGNLKWEGDLEDIRTNP
ncbi:type II toxin-antitoxin system VapB family antitoxin [Cylindrospermum sp. FACHB-282]|uniref:type II toxin-antitoxin system VapB family antitoxin n=1 Tax=Cylindrospermum sp. FACHB-282 TaxID=2692794 RepID=UPI001687C1E0|nr:type II toxin-antitoxin system VapB family antitoxin [Cylindrospermum sp. FACHB-282]MBD2387434.1 type II toxin-antitoxin system VapB family antitoxin [Cylindrospermum sp. FACHB-282]